MVRHARAVVARAELIVEPGFVEGMSQRLLLTDVSGSLSASLQNASDQAHKTATTSFPAHVEIISKSVTIVRHLLKMTKTRSLFCIQNKKTRKLKQTE